MRTVYCDVDDTLITWYIPKEETESPLQTLSNHGVTVPAVVNQNLIDQLRIHKSRGHKIVLWSAGGEDWAREAAQITGISHLVDVYLSKPDFLYDDKNPSEFMPKPQLLKF